MAELKTSFSVNETDDPCEYDCDTADTSWLESWTRDHSGTSLTVENFEKTMEFLEDNSQETVPSIDMLNLRKFTKKREAGAIYDYWLDKRLKTRKRLVPHFKRGGKWRSFDPFVAFRPCEEKMRTRKNRAADHNKYSKLLKIRSWLDGYANSLKDMRNQEIQRHNSLVQKLYEFSAQYKSNSLQDEFLEWMNWPQSGTETVKIEECPSSEDECELKTLVDDQTVDSDYLKPIESNILDDEHGFFRISQSYLIRRRVGRGGRIIIDRRTDSSNYKKMEVAFKSMNINPTVDCWKFSFMLEQCDTSSVFKLKDTCVDENIEYNKVEFEEI